MIQQWNHPYFIYLVIPLMACMLLYEYHMLWMRLRVCVLEQTLKKNAKPANLGRIKRRFAGVGLIAFAISSCVLYFLPLSTPLFSFILIVIFDAITILGVHFYTQLLLSSSGILSDEIVENIRRFTGYRHSGFVHFKQALLCLSLLLMILAVMGPEGNEKTSRLRRTPLVVTVVFDLSASMDATDNPPSRLDAARDELLILLEQCSGDEVGLVFFTSSAVVQSPQTFDYSAIKAFLRTAHKVKLPDRGSDLNEALKMALDTFDEKEDAFFSDAQYQTRRVVLVTDGETHTGSIDDTLNDYLRRNVHIDVLAMGTEKGSEILNDEGQPMLYQGQPVISKVDTQLLKHIAQTTNGAFHLYTVPQLSAQTLISSWTTLRINTQPTGVASSVYRVQYYAYFLYPAYFILVAFLIHPVFVHLIRARRKEKKFVPQEKDSTYSRLRGL